MPDCRPIPWVTLLSPASPWPTTPAPGTTSTPIAEAKQAGGRVVKPAKDTDWGGYVGYFADPDGHLWEVAWNPGFTLLADGSVRLPE